jgi:hypothetical protein
MQVSDAQREVRTVFRGGFIGQLVSGLLWLASALVATAASPEAGIVVLIVGGFFIFPLTQLGLRLLGGPWKLSPDNPLNGLGMQVAFVLPLCLPLVLAASHHHQPWFYPAFMILLGAHYLPFVFLYGMRMFAVLAVILVVGGLVIAHYPGSFALGGWVTGVILLGFAEAGRRRTKDSRTGG